MTAQALHLSNTAHILSDSWITVVTHVANTAELDVQSLSRPNSSLTHTAEFDLDAFALQISSVMLARSSEANLLPPHLSGELTLACPRVLDFQSLC